MESLPQAEPTGEGDEENNPADRKSAVDRAEMQLEPGLGMMSMMTDPRLKLGKQGIAPVDAGAAVARGYGKPFYGRDVSRAGQKSHSALEPARVSL